VPTFREAKSTKHADTSRIALPDMRGWVIGRLPLFRKPGKSQRQSFANASTFETSVHRRRWCAAPIENLSMTEDMPPLGRPNPELDRIAGPQKVMLALTALGTAVFMAAMFYLLIVMK